MVTECDIYTARLRACDAVVGFPCLTFALQCLTPVITEEVATAMTDRYWRTYVNPRYFAELTPDEGSTVLVHEVWHMLLEHFARADKLQIPYEEHKLFNTCCDCEINQHDALWKRLPHEPVTPASLRVPESLLAEQYYALLRQRPNVKLSNCGSCAHGHTESYELPPPDGKSIPGLMQARAHLVIQETARQIQTASQAAGTVPAGWRRWAGRVLQPQADWRSLLQSHLQDMIIARLGHYYQNFRRPSRRQQLQPDLLKPAHKDAKPQLAVIVDTSDSMSDQQGGQCLAEVAAILAFQSHRVTTAVYFTNTVAAAVQKVFTADELIAYGGGGTDMGAGFLAIEETARLDPGSRPSTIVVLTDGYTPWPAQPPDNTQVLICLVGQGKPPNWAQPPNHQVITVDTV